MDNQVERVRAGARRRAGRGGARRIALTTGCAGIYALTVFLGRLTRMEGTPLALVWPAAAVGVLWLALSWRDRRQLVADAALLAVVAGAVNVLTGATPAMGVVFGVANLVQSVVACWVLHRLQLRWGTAVWRLRQTADLGALVVASAVGSGAAALVGPVGLWLTQDAALLPTMGAWVLRNAAGTFVFSALVLRLADRELPPAIRGRRQAAELVLAGVSVSAAYTAVFGMSAHLPLAYLLVPLSMWLALRFDTTIAAAHVMLTGFFVVSLTLDGRGPFAIDGPWARVSLAQAFVTVTGLVALVLALHRDERAQLIRSLGLARERADEQAALLEEASRQKSAFLATMSHEIRTPLNGVLGLTTLLRQSDLDPRQRSWAQTAERSGRALLSIVNDVLDTAKIEAGAIELEEVPFDLRTVVDDAVLPLRHTARRKGLALTVACAARLDPHRAGDPTRLRQVVTNLIANAVKFTAHGSVTVTLDGDGSSVTVTVTDTGIGMTDQQQTRLFDPYVQADRSTTREYGGTGLGLSISQGLARRMGGAITVASAPAVGSSFRLDVPLPVAPPACPATEDLDHPVAEPLPPGVRVLVAEDNEVNQMVARATLEARGVQVDVVADGASAVAAATTRQYAAVFMDCQMPGTDGLEAARRIRAVEAACPGDAPLPIIAMTASAFDADRQACRDAGMDGFLPKPWTVDQLTRALAMVLTAAPTADAVPASTAQPSAPTGAAGGEVAEEVAGVRDRLTELFEDVPAAEAAPVQETLLRAFLDRTGELLADLAVAAARADDEAVARAAHGIKGAAANVGAHDLATLAASIEERAGSTDPETAARLVQRLQARFDLLRPLLAGLTARSAGAAVPSFGGEVRR